MSKIEYALKKLSSNFVGKDKSLAGPVEIMWPTAGVWTCATDGRGMLWVRGSLHPETPVAVPDGEGKKLSPLFELPSGEQHLVDLAALRAFAGQAVWMEECPACKGTSKASEHVSCSFCDDDGEMIPECRYGWLYGVLIDCSRLACLLSPFDDDKRVALIVHEYRGFKNVLEHRLHVAGENWRVVLMGMTPQTPGLDDYEKQQAAPRHPEGT